MLEVQWNRLTATELNALAKRDAIVLLPVASTEQHGPHLTTGVDMFLGADGCRRIAEKVSAERPCIVAPAVWMGLAEHHVAFGGTFTLSLATWHAVLRDLCRSILRAGFTKILLVNSHGGNMSALNALTVDLTQELGAQIATTTLYARRSTNGHSRLRGGNVDDADHCARLCSPRPDGGRRRPGSVGVSGIVAGAAHGQVIQHNHRQWRDRGRPSCHSRKGRALARYRGDVGCRTLD
jgi:Creatinine amidohydrolase